MATPRPINYLNWTDGAPSKVVQPDSSFLLQGWVPGQAPPAQYANWQGYLTDQWIKYFDEAISPGIPDQALRLLNGGNWSFDLGTSAFSWDQDANLGFASVPDANNTITAASVTILDGQVAYVNANTPFIVQATSQNGSNVLTDVSFTAALAFGMTVTGPGIQAGTTIQSVGANSVTLTLPATASNVGATIIFSNSAALSVIVVDNSAFIPDFDTIMIARRSGDQVYVGVNTGQMLLRDKESKPLLGSGYFTVYDGTAGENLTQGDLVYISEGAGDGGRNSGELYKLDCGALNSGTRAVFAGVVITSAISGDPVKIMFDGFFTYAGLTLGAKYYADPAVAGGITDILPSGAGEKVVVIGVALTSTQILVSSGGGQSGLFSQPVFHKDSLGTAGGTIYNLSTLPLSNDALFLYVDGLYLPKSEYTLVGTQVTMNVALVAGQELEAQYVLAGQAYLTAHQETAVPSILLPLQEYVLAFQPLNKVSLNVFIDGAYAEPALYSIIFNNNGTTTISFATPLVAGQEVDATYLAPVGVAGSGGGITGATNLGTGAGVYASTVLNNLQLKSIKAGAGINVNVSPTEIEIVNVGAGSAPGIYGSAGTPHVFNPLTGLTIGSEMDQIYYLATGAGALTVTAAIQIQAGSTIGQRLTLRGLDATNYYIFQGVSGSYFQGLSLNGDCYITNNQCLKLYWDGAGWYEESRRT